MPGLLFGNWQNRVSILVNLEKPWVLSGRFVGVQGSFTLERLINLGTGFTAGLFQGTITCPGAAQ
jgi:hypothetical protein